jgi:HD superfamily phosphohydrolase
MSEIPELTEYYQTHQVVLDDYICELVKIAGLCHDLGHGPFSHVFDDVFIPAIKKANKLYTGYNKNDTHEYRSSKILKHIVNNNDFLRTVITKQELKFIKTLINPSSTHKGFIYQIISNNLNSVDVDKYDYLERDTHNLDSRFGFNSSRLIDDVRIIDNTICFPEQMYYEVVSIFTTRYRLHKQVYSHKAVLSIQHMIYEIMNLLDPIMHIYDKINNVTSFCTLTDDYILAMVNILYSTRTNYSVSDQSLIEDAYNIWKNICTRHLYRFIRNIVSKTDISDKLSQFDDEHGIIIKKSNIGFVSGNKTNPLDNLYFYRNKDYTKRFKIEQNDVTCLLPLNYQEYVYSIFIKDKDDKELEERLHAFVC